MAKLIKYVVDKLDNECMQVIKGQKCRIKKSYFYNGEGYYKLEAEDGTLFDSPDIFWAKL